MRLSIIHRPHRAKRRNIPRLHDADADRGRCDVDLGRVMLEDRWALRLSILMVEYEQRLVPGNAGGRYHRSKDCDMSPCSM